MNMYDISDAKLNFAHFNSQYTIASICFGIIMIVFLWVRYPKDNPTLNSFRRFTTLTVLAAILDVIAAFLQYIISKNLLYNVWAIVDGEENPQFEHIKNIKAYGYLLERLEKKRNIG